MSPAETAGVEGAANRPGTVSARAVGEAGTLTARGERTRRVLTTAGRRVFETAGFHDARIVDVAAAAGCAVGSFYSYFESKEELFLVLLIELENEVYEEPDRLPVTADPVQRMRETNRLYFESFRRNSAFWAVVEQARLQSDAARQLLVDRHQYHRSRTFRALSAWQQEGLIPEDVNVEFAATALGAMTERCAYLWFVMGEPMQFDDAVEEITRLWVKGLGLRSRPRKRQTSSNR